MRYCGHFLIKAEGGAKNYERDHPLPLALRPFTVVFVQRKGYTRPPFFAGKNGHSTAASFQVFLCQYVYKLTVLKSLTFLLGLLSAVLIAVAFHHLSTKPLFYFACFYSYFAVFWCRGYCRLAAIV